MTTKKKSQNDITDHHSSLWQIYSDMNTRFNIISEESLHLQDSLASMMNHKWAFDSCFNSDFDPKQDNENTTTTDSTKPRETVRNELFGKHKHFYELSSNENSFLSLIKLLGGVTKWIEANKKTLFDSYEHAAKDAANDESTAYFKLLSLRGFYMIHVTEKYTKILQYVHEKLVQLLETLPSALPQPILLRRWNSSLQEVFLARYSRHINWETSMILGKALELSDDEINVVWDRISVLHTWDHKPFSCMSSYNYSEKANKENHENPENPTILVSSAYFYLEQPNLFPLLFHEISHHHIEWRKKTLADKPPLFLSRLIEVSETLQQVFPRQDTDEWDRLCCEIWTDSIAITACGQSYLLALASQLMGLSGTHCFDTQKSNGHPIEYCDLGKHHTRSFAINDVARQSCHELSWEARLEFSCWLLDSLMERGHWKKDIKDDESYKIYVASAKEVTSSIRSDIIKWHDQGKLIYNSQLTSDEHQAHWNYRIEINEQLYSVWIEAFEDCINLLPKNTISKNYWLCNEKGEIEKQLISKLKGAVDTYLINILHVKEKKERDGYLDDLPGSIIRIEECATKTRLIVSKIIAKNIQKAVTEDRDLSTLTNFADYVRHDGSSIFRVALEWLAARDSLLEHIATELFECTEASKVEQFLENIKKELEPNDKNFASVAIKDNMYWFEEFEKLDEANAKNNKFEFDINVEAKKSQRVRNLVARCLKRREFLVKKDDEKNFCDYARKLLTDLNTSSIMEEIIDALVENEKEIGIGTMALGQFRTGNESLIPNMHRELVTRMYKYLENCGKLKDKFRGRSFFKQNAINDKNIFMPLIGDYDYIHVSSGITLTERDTHLQNMPKLVSKPRIVLEIPTKKSDTFGTEQNRLNFDKNNDYIGKVTLIKFRYRWQWINLKKRIENRGCYENYPSPLLFLSSSWEDVVLITWYHGFTDLVIDSQRMGILNDGKLHIDSQTNLVPPWNNKTIKTRICVENAECKKCPPDTEKYKNFGNTGVKHEILGRYDRSIFFHADNVYSECNDRQKWPVNNRWPTEMNLSNNRLKDYFHCLCSRDDKFWGECANFTTSILWETTETNEDDKPEYPPDKPILCKLSLRMTLLSNNGKLRKKK